MKKIISLILGIFLLSFVSASISISPNEFSLNVYPGETVLKNISINTDNICTVNLTSISEANITLNYSSPLIVDGNKIVEVSFYIPTGIENGTYNIYINATTSYTETVVEIVSGGGSSTHSSGGNRLLGIINVIPGIANPTVSEPKPIEISNPPNKEDKTDSILFGAVIISVIVFVALVYLAYYLRLRKKK